MLKLVDGGAAKASARGEASQDLLHHESILESYLQSHRIRNHSSNTIKKEEGFLRSWFKAHGDGMRLLYVWEAMTPVTGRKRIQDYGSTMLINEVSTDTVRSYLGILRRYFSYVLEYPFVITSSGPRRLQDLYGSIDQPVTEYDIPHHVYNGERLGVPLDPEKLYEFYAILRKEYLNRPGRRAVSARNYAMAVLAGESGLRCDELLKLEIKKDLFFKSHKLQTRHAKAMKGSGKRNRITLFPPLARDTVKAYLAHHRPNLCILPETDHLFISQAGKPMTYQAVHGALGEMVKVSQQAGFPVSSHLGWHWFRRLFATRFIERFPNKLAALVDLLGHVTPNTVHCYIRHSEAWMDKEIQTVLEGVVAWPSIGD